MEIEVSVFMAILSYFKKDKGWTKRVGKNQFIRVSTLMGSVYIHPLDLTVCNESVHTYGASIL